MYFGVQWSDVVAVVALVVACAAYVRARRLAAKLVAMHEAYWELRYQYGEVKAQLARGQSAAPASSPPPDGPPREGFIPLASLKR